MSSAQWIAERVAELLEEWRREAEVVLESDVVPGWHRVERFLDGRSGVLPSIADIFGLAPDEVAKEAREALAEDIEPRLLRWIRPAFGPTEGDGADEADDAAERAAEKMAVWLAGDGPADTPPEAHPTSPPRKAGKARKGR